MARGREYDPAVRAWILHEPSPLEQQPLRLEELPDLVPGPGEVQDAGIRPEITEFPFEQANEGLLAIREDRVDGSAVLRIRQT